MRLLFIISLSLFFSSISFGQLTQIIDAIAESGSIVFTSTENTATKKKNVDNKITFTAKENIYGTIYMKQKLERLRVIIKDDKYYIRTSFLLKEDHSKKFYWSIPLPKDKTSMKSICFEVSPDKMDVKNPNHLGFLNLIETLENKKHEFLVYITERDGVRGKLILDLSEGKGKYQDLFEALEKERQRIAAAEEVARIAAQKERERYAAERKKIVDAYEASTDFVYVTFINNSYVQISGAVATSNNATNSSFSISAKHSKKVRCRPGEQLYIANKVVLDVTAASNGQSIDISPPPLSINSMATQWSGDDAWKSWTLKTSAGNWSLATQWSGDDAWKSWTIKTGNENWSVSTQWSGDDAWKSWNFKTDNDNFTMKTQWSGKDAWKSWTITSKYGDFLVKTQWSGDDAWKSWSITSPHGDMLVKTQWSGDDAWKSWSITDNMQDAPPQAKMAAIFCCMVGGIMPYTSTKASCALHGKKLYGKVKFVEYGEDVKIKYVDYSEDLKVEFVSSSPNDCGEWQVVESSEDLKVKVVEYGEDLKVKKVTSSPGMK
ncbi:MAG: Unknown protein [uncultured Aureispira sp.]|uniref:7(1) septoil knot domain-containing protein n=1 Tax=uncultured Aureispira sp. TaxID=1331704 RepID=A0A6S6TXC2_9BACT|nr:MAG: Unknown protein [uncultured Aureispira sp.]